MGYYTDYELEIKFRCPDCEQLSPCNKNVERKIRKMQIPEYERPLGSIMDDGFNSVKWYDNERDMKLISRQFPNVLFSLSGEGEETGDIWKKYFLNGKVHHAIAEIVVADFDFKKLV